MRWQGISRPTPRPHPEKLPELLSESLALRVQLAPHPPLA